ncbi:hypothetical protein FGADI_11147 [Fusarium gaditjirri]|uniref:Uncharacterized protein n=1 Tax=Fusarium gaditjirri TaxID=282569 RepID=A0A8H4SVE5_9HYPO|nr:hypothetical protein FGADI_11147 [Fusarium gaditjirri]
MSNTNPNLPTPTIDKTTYYDVASKQLNLVISYPSGISSWPKDIIVYLITPPSTSPNKVGNGPPTFPANSNTGTMVMPLALTSPYQGGQLTVASLDASWDSSTPSDPWQIPAFNSSPFTSAPVASFTSLGSVEVTWTWIPDMGATAQQVTLTIAGQSPIATIVKKPTATANFTMAQANNLFTPGLSVIIQCTPITPGLWATPVKTTFHIPKSTYRTPFPLNASPPISSECTMTSLWAQGSNTMQAWWETPAGAIQTAQFPLGEFQQQSEQFSNASTVPVTGSCLASIYASATNQQVWWITATGAIDGQVNSGKGWASPGTGPGEAYPFNQPGVATTGNGGSVASLLLEGNNGIILFWVDPKGGIGSCRWSSSSGWQAVSNALPPGTVSATTQLTTLSMGSNAYLFCVAADGSIVCGNWSDASSATLGLMSQSVVAPAGSAAPAGGLVSISVSAQEMAIFWATPKNNIEMALLFAGASFRNIQRPLTVPQSVLAGTGIAVYSEEAN